MTVYVADKSNDRAYRIETPQIVWALCDDVYEFTLWNVVKMIAGETGECMLATKDLADAAMMSTGKASQCRKALIKKGLLKGEIRQDPGYPQPVWHLTVPDLWPENIAWRQKNQSLKGRIKAKRQEKKSLHQMKPSPGEEGPSPGEEGPPPDETKKEPKEETKKNNHSCREPQEVHEANAENVIAHHPTLGPIIELSEKETMMEIADVMTVKEIKRLDLTREQWKLLYEAEKACKDRVTAKRHIRRMLETRPPSVDVYREIAETFPKKALWDVMDRVVGQDNDDLEFWRKVVTAYVACGWNPRNVENMLRYFRDRMVPTTNGDMNGRKPKQESKQEKTEGERARIEWRRKQLAKITGPDA